ncbi:MAG: flagellar hook-associated protein FlgL [Desulfovibrio sp.]|jgi:flagellar hook-associated protein 3 FlgL|nr:flagellar hook-associated protein FlgL [Desulfovibrio sp.]
MAIRVTQGMMYGSFVRDMNRTLSDYMDSNIQASSMKKINKPSDDPVGAGRVLSSRATLSRLDIYDENIATAKGWLSTADSVLASGDGSVQSLLSQIQVLAEQAATGTVTADNRLQIAQQVRGLMSQLVSLANTEFAGSNIFAGHKTTGTAYAETLGVSLHGENMDNYRYVDLVAAPLDGGALPSRVVSFVPVNGGGGTAGTATYYYTADGGKTWEPATVTGDTAPSPGCTVSGGGVSVHISDADVPVTRYYDPPGGTNPLSDQSSLAQGTWFCVRPSAVYLGDDTDTQVSTTYIPEGATLTIGAKANGYFARDVAVRLDPYLSTDTATPGFLRYSYSVDDGSNWISATAPLPPPPPPPGAPMTLPVPGGSLTLDPSPTAAAGTPPTLDDGVEGMQFIIHPHRADVNFQISEASQITVNMVGKDVFGGLYNYPGDFIKNYNNGTPYEYTDTATGQTVNVYNDRPIAVGSENPYYNDGIPNMFESVGELICALECNSQTGVQKSLDKLKDVMNHILAKAAEIGGREKRIAATESALILRRYSEEDRLSQIEDVDLLELEARLAAQQTAYNAVLKSTSMIMQLGLVNFL